jgi:hypothetical protein
MEIVVAVGEGVVAEGEESVAVDEAGVTTEGMIAGDKFGNEVGELHPF